MRTVSLCKVNFLRNVVFIKVLLGLNVLWKELISIDDLGTDTGVTTQNDRERPADFTGGPTLGGWLAGEQAHGLFAQSQLLGSWGRVDVHPVVPF